MVNASNSQALHQQQDLFPAPESPNPQPDLSQAPESESAESKLDKIPLHTGASIRRPNGDVIVSLSLSRLIASVIFLHTQHKSMLISPRIQSILKSRRQIPDPLEPLDMDSNEVRADADEAVAKVAGVLM